MTEAVLLDAGYEFMTAVHWPEALKHLSGNPGHFTALVTDYSMAMGLTEADIIERMRGEYPIMPVALTSAYFNAIPENWQHRETTKYFPKPYDPGQPCHNIGLSVVTCRLT